MKRFLSEYTHVDGTQWTGPDFYADTRAEAEAYAAGYPVQPTRIIGEHLETIAVPDSDMVKRVVRTAGERTH